MADREIQHNWQRDPTIPQVVEGGTGGDGSIGGGGGSLITKDITTAQALSAISATLCRIELHLQAMTDERITDKDIRE